MTRAILHCDLNSFYASVEIFLDPTLKGKAVAVCGSVEDRHGIVLANRTRQRKWEYQQVKQCGRQRKNVLT